jgi:hypothetical protein
MGQQFIVENKPGAGSTIAYATGIKSPPDGYTLTLITVTYTVNPSVYKLKSDPVNDITPLDAKVQSVDPAPHSAGQFVGDLVRRYVMCQATGLTHETLQCPGSAHGARS